MSTPITLAFVGCRQTLADGLATRFTAEQDLRVVAVKPSGSGLREFLLRHQPSVVVVESSGPGARGRDLVAEICALANHPAVVVIVSNSEPSRAVEAGALGVVDQSSSTAELLSAIRWAAKGTMWISPVLIAGVIDQSWRTSVARDELLAGLTNREQEILHLLVEGLDAAAIAERLCINLTTAKTHLYNVRRKLGVRSCMAAVAAALNAGIRPDQRRAIA